LNIGDGRNHVDGTSSDNHGGLSAQKGASSRVDLIRGNSVDIITVLVEGQVAIGHEVASNFFEAVLGVLEVGKNLHLELILGSVELSISDRLTETVHLFEEDVHQVSGVRSGTLNADTEDTRVSEVRVERVSSINEVVLLQKAGGSSVEHTLAGVTAGKRGGGTDKSVHQVEGSDILVVPGSGLKSKGDVGLRSFSPGSVLTTNVLRRLSGEFVLGNGKHISKTLLNEVNVLTVVLDTGGDDEALLGGNVVHNELLEHTSINVSNIVLKTKARHTKGVVTIGGSESELLVVGERIELAQVVVEIVGFLVLGLGDVGSENRAGLKGNINHHLEHIDGIVLNAVTLEVGALLIEIHLHGTTGHLDHTVVDGLVSVLQSLQVGVLEGLKSTTGLGSLVTSTDVHKETHVNGTGEGLALSEDGETVAQVGDVVLSLLILVMEELVALELLGRVEFTESISSGSRVDLVEESVEHTRVLARGELFLYI